MKFSKWMMLLLTVSCMTLAGCTPPADDGSGAGAGDAGDSNTTAVDTSTETLAVANILCGDCGEQKGSGTCCVAEVETCDCGLHKGSALCCVDLGDSAGQDICADCGHVALVDHTCPTGEDVCQDCGLHKGSVACCKLNS